MTSNILKYRPLLVGELSVFLGYHLGVHCINPYTLFQEELKVRASPILTDSFKIRSFQQPEVVNRSAYFGRRPGYTK